eukprot:CAMPEP_0113393622 /NCGR_PEP_ID=MMETSP0013_2-20120614/12007_1 /TAXON_ID=2843 ORGANISM="Skeletonema costatum, Strain 1716" /NCGR_SAMPLE_ID=MMETSP0013_2 /ASSEMBLY_ACC=CAM_ASM_000158 /LENGTH=282 /DNA_ID=CAMNT_0000277275 /DNA_START=27 /DNA_END=875 /DNA_ORIENTATION=- /assembly_acc=CAM_ASM_000158
MVSRKKAKGKARKAAAKAKKEEEKEAHNDSSAAAAQQREHEQEGALEAQMQRLLIDSLPSPCKHGFDPFPEGENCDRFVSLFLETFNAGIGNKDGKKIDTMLEAVDAVDKKYPEVLYDSSKMKHILSYFLSGGTDHILNGRDGAARTTVAVIIMFEEFIAFSVLKTKAVLHLQKLKEIFIADDHTLVSFFRKRITCSCLDKKHKEVKSIKKMGYCNNEKCPLPGGKVERSKMLYCTRCSVEYYCSRDCQKDAWSEHREFCKEKAERNAKFEQEMRIRDQNSM